MWRMIQVESSTCVSYMVHDEVNVLSSYLSMTGRIENPSCSACGHSYLTPLISFCNVQLRTLCAARSLAILCHSTISGPGCGELRGFWGSMFFRHDPILRKGSGNRNNNRRKNESGLKEKSTVLGIALNSFEA